MSLPDPWIISDGEKPAGIGEFERVETRAGDRTRRPVMFARHVEWTRTALWRRTA